MFEIDPKKSLEQVETQLEIKPLKFIIGFTDEYFVIAKRGGIQSDDFKYAQDPLQDDGESRFVDIWNFCVIKLSEGGHLLKFQSVRGKDVITKDIASNPEPPPPPNCPDGNPRPPLPGGCATLFRFGK